MLLRVITLITLVLTLLACSEPPYENLNNTQLKAMMAQGVPVFDIRRVEEWRQTGVIKGSQLLTFVDNRGQVMPDFMPRFTGTVDKSKPVILICRSGNRSGTLARHLVEKMGFTQVYNVRDGMNQWLREKNAVTRKTN